MRRTWATGSRQELLSSRASIFGFTLIELLVVLAIMVMVVAAAPASLQKLSPKLRVTAVSSRLLTDLQWMRVQALATAEPVSLTRTDTGYRLSSREQSKAVFVPQSVRLAIAAIPTGQAVRTVIAYPDGSTTPVQFEISDSGRRAAVRVDMITGRAWRVRA